MVLVLPASAFAGGSVGSSTLYPSADSNTAGQAESFRNTASASGPVDSLRVYLTPDNNVTIENLDIPGPVAVDGSNATIRNSRIQVHSGCSSPCGSYGIRLGQSGQAVSGTLLQNLDTATVEQNPANDNPQDPSTIDSKVDHGVRNNGDLRVTADGLYVRGFAGAWKGPGTITNSYLFSQLVFSGDHVEAYLNGGEGNPSVLSPRHDPQPARPDRRDLVLQRPLAPSGRSPSRTTSWPAAATSCTAAPRTAPATSAARSSSKTTASPAATRTAAAISPKAANTASGPNSTGPPPKPAATTGTTTSHPPEARPARRVEQAQ